MCIICPDTSYSTHHPHGGINTPHNAWVACICIYELYVGDTYYWNRATNETSWVFPNASACVYVHL